MPSTGNRLSTSSPKLAAASAASSPSGRRSSPAGTAQPAGHCDVCGHGTIGNRHRRLVRHRIDLGAALQRGVVADRARRHHGERSPWCRRQRRDRRCWRRRSSAADCSSGRARVTVQDAFGSSTKPSGGANSEWLESRATSVPPSISACGSIAGRAADAQAKAFDRLRRKIGQRQRIGKALRPPWRASRRFPAGTRISGEWSWQSLKGRRGGWFALEQSGIDAGLGIRDRVAPTVRS